MRSLDKNPGDSAKREVFSCDYNCGETAVSSAALHSGLFVQWLPASQPAAWSRQYRGSWMILLAGGFLTSAKLRVRPSLTWPGWVWGESWCGEVLQSFRTLYGLRGPLGLFSNYWETDPSCLYWDRDSLLLSLGNWCFYLYSLALTSSISVQSALAFEYRYYVYMYSVVVLYSKRKNKIKYGTDKWNKISWKGSMTNCWNFIYFGFIILNFW